MPKQAQEKITADLEFLVGDTVVLVERGLKFTPLEYQYLLTQAEGIQVRVSRTNGEARFHTDYTASA